MYKLESTACELGCEDDCLSISSGPRSRLSRLHPKIVGDVKLRAVENKGTGSKHRQSIEIPMDVLLDIAECLQPLDILQLSRVSKYFRSIFTSRTARYVWNVARRKMPNMPDCSDMTEMQYASLVFERQCQACGTEEYSKTDYSLRVRFCTPCASENLKNKHTLSQNSKVPTVIFTLLPQSRSGGFFYVPEFEMVLNRYQGLKPDLTALEAFIKERKNMVSQMKNDTDALWSWVSHRTAEKEIMDHRQAEIEAKLVQLGFQREDFPDINDQKWKSLLRGPRELQPRAWGRMRPKLERLIKANKEANIQRAFDTRCKERRDEFLPLWAEFLAAISDPVKRDLMPTHADACNFPVINAMLYGDGAQIPVTEERWSAVVSLIPAWVKEFQANVKNDLIKCLKIKTREWRQCTPESTNDADENSDFNAIVDKPSSLFTCNLRNSEELIGYSTILRHMHMHNLTWSYVSVRIYHEPQIEHTVNMVLKLLRLPGDTTLSAMEKLDERLVCLCGHPEFRINMTFGSLISHIVYKNGISASHMRYRNTLPRYLGEANKNHNLYASVPFIAILSPNGTVEPAYIYTFPQHIERRIFEEAASDNTRTACQLALVARHVQSWVEPIIYRYLTLRTPELANALLRSLDITTKPPSFYTQSIKALCMRYYDSGADWHGFESYFKLLPYCRGVTHFVCWLSMKSVSAKLADLITAMRPTSIKAPLTNLLGTLDPNFSLPFFDNVTHLHILDPNCSAWTGIHLLPRLSHIHLCMHNIHRPVQVVSDLLGHCKTLQVCVICLEPTRKLRSSLETIRLQVPKDDRLVFIAHYWDDLRWDWECSLGVSHLATWAYAESVVRRQQQTGCRVEARYVYGPDGIRRLDYA